MSGVVVARFHSACLNWAIAPSLTPPPNNNDNDLAPRQSSTDPLFHYSHALSTPLPNAFAALHAHTMHEYPTHAEKSVSELQGQFLRLLMRMTRPKRVLELGCFLGYSALAMAEGMPPGGTLYTCEKDSAAAQQARSFFIAQGYPPRSHSSSSSTVSPETKTAIELLEGDALASLDVLARNQIQFDAIFLDANKGGYISHFDFIMDNNLLSKHGFILADNILFRGLVLNSVPAKNKNTLPSPPPSPTLGPSDHQSSEQGQDLTPAPPRQKSALQKTANHMDAFNRH
ncbi:hypothetical protein BGZ94_002983, partial [Podila epigama]